MVRAADDRGNNKYLEWRQMKKDVMLTFASGESESAQWQDVRDFLQFTHQNLEQIKADKQVIDRRDPYREENEALTLRFR